MGDVLEEAAYDSARPMATSAGHPAPAHAAIVAAALLSFTFSFDDTCCRVHERHHEHLADRAVLSVRFGLTRRQRTATIMLRITWRSDSDA